MFPINKPRPPHSRMKKLATKQSWPITITASFRSLVKISLLHLFLLPSPHSRPPLSIRLLLPLLLSFVSKKAATSTFKLSYIPFNSSFKPWSLMWLSKTILPKTRTMT
ncbi:hypothetical protein K457DRAFT_636411 [Linnemannia elongata AG-77]|uniref:Uncharacterized protein n=1 Tax=Linnemannia elongata AG-77 TaxID=1314771 RepID=A0A197JQL8_9FUNG|nr:hypothetical protein K457DRAFT_636411 [Linnemannia elongata AG-77]